MTLQELNDLPEEKFKEAFFQCCGCVAWVAQLAQLRPYSSVKDLKDKSDNIWFSCDEISWLEAFTHHPKIGDIESLEKKFAATKEFASAEQSGVHASSELVLHQLKEENDRYENKFGFIFIVCATGKSAEEMLSLLQERIKNDRSDELKIAITEQNKITHLRIAKLIT